MKKIDEALFLINFDTMEVLWSTLKNQAVIDYWYAKTDRGMEVHDGQKDHTGFGNNAYYVYVKL